MLQSLKIWGADSNVARRRCPAAPSDLPKSGGAAAPPAPPLGASLVLSQISGGGQDLFDSTKHSGFYYTSKSFLLKKIYC